MLRTLILPRRWAFYGALQADLPRCARLQPPIHPRNAAAKRVRGRVTHMFLEIRQEVALVRPGSSSSAAIRLWAALLARIYEVFPLICPRCGGAVRLIAFLTERAAIARILTHLGEPTVPPALAAARAPPHAAAEFDQRPARDVDQPEPVPDIDFDQSHGW